VFLYISLSSLHTLASLWSVAAGHITPEAVCMDQQAETFYGFLPCSLQSKTSLLSWTTPCSLLWSSFSLCIQSSGRSQFQPLSNSGGNRLGILTICVWISGGVYRNWCLNTLEGSFALNLLILVVATYHVKLSGGNQLAVGYTSVIIALITFIVILAYHIFLQVRDTKLWKKIPKLRSKWNKNHVVNQLQPIDNSEVLCEPLLEDPPKPNYGAF